MKGIWSVFCAIALFSLSDPVQAGHYRHHTHHATRHRYTLEGSKAAMDAALKSRHKNLDIRSIKALEDSTAPVTTSTRVQADVVGTDQDVADFAAAGALQSSTKVLSGKHIRGHVTTASKPLKIHKDKEYNEAQVVANDRGAVAACVQRTEGYLDDLRAATTDNSSQDLVYTDSPFFECFRPSHEVFEFLDELAKQNPEFMTKYENVSSTYEGRSIAAFKISSSKDGEETEKQTLYTQALIHAREWQAGAATFFTMASMLDDLRAGKPEATDLFARFDWYFVPIVNIDGYKYTWEVDRMWRTNRHLVERHGQHWGVDLNRNWPPQEYFNLDPSDVDSETYPGEYPLSEPSTAGLFDFITSLDYLSGLVDMHTFGGDVLRPFSNQEGGGAEPFGSKMKALGEGVRKALSTQPDVQYVSEMGSYLYKAYGCFDDGMFLHYNLTVPALTIEVEGDDFVSPQSSIRPVGRNIYLGLRQFAHEALTYSKFVHEQYSAADTDSEDEELSSNSDSDSDSDSDSGNDSNNNSNNSGSNE
ncbi:hypothetical protein PHYBOEH_000584 [Phytophthora boehmeriae]|uniref:Peptidase M14 domain-containing protein n=1 Tax=Phytophthora boehmeriae TaxID=109152 RepID=A0A8T1X6W6_9STRA|nr:hypothetical protein PHYBOEH_000584 [Phytophthora boehmeriae]